MRLVHHPITQALTQLCDLMSSDFAALGLIESDQLRARWRYVVGNRSERYKQMLLKPGIGPAGVALRIGKPVLWDDRVPFLAGLPADCPIITAEQLRSAAALPITKERTIEAVLLVARRSPLPYSMHDVERMSDIMNPLLPIMER